MDHSDLVLSRVKTYVLDTFLPGEDPDELEAETPLITGGILDSISTVRLVSFLEAEFDVKFQAHEMSPANLDTLTKITTIVNAKKR